MRTRGLTNELGEVATTARPFDEERAALDAIADPAAFAPLYRRYLPEMLALSYRRLGNHAEAEDIAAEIFRKALSGRHTFRGGSFRKWIYTIALNTLRDYASRPLPPVVLLDLVSDPNPGPEELALRAAADADVRAALLQLPDEWQLVVELRSQGYRCGDVAGTIGRDADWVRVTHHRAMERLARELGVARVKRVRHG